MRLLVYTQAIDTSDPLLGFFHRWVEELAKYFDHIHVVCLKKGTYQLPPNVSVYSLGKEDGESNFKYIINFYRHLFRLRNQYDRVFVHMNPHYVLLGGIYWKFKNIPISWWRNHAKMNLMTRIAAPLSKNLFYTSPFACLSRYAHAIQMPVGIDVLRFSPTQKSQNSKTKVLLLGRLSPVKHPELFLEAGALLGDAYEMHVYGSDPTREQKYGLMLEKMASKNTFFHGSVKNEDTPAIYQAHDIYVNLTPQGSMDKTVLEAAACETQVIALNASFADVLPPISILSTCTARDLADKIIFLAHLPSEEKNKNVKASREAVVRDHSVLKLAELLHLYITR